MKLTQFELPFSDDFTIRGEYEGNQESGKAIIFSHGFGNLRDSQGLFNQISHVLKKNFLTVKFDYNQHNAESNTILVPIPSYQKKTLEMVKDYVLKKFTLSSIIIIGHSLGSAIASQSNTEEIQQFLFLAPPVVSPYPLMHDRFTSRKHTVFNPKGNSKILRSDGTWTIIEKEFWQEVKRMEPTQLYQQAAQSTPTIIVQATDDHVLIDEDYSPLEDIPNIDLITLSGDHNFSPPHRQKLLDTIQSIFKEAL